MTKAVIAKTGDSRFSIEGELNVQTVGGLLIESSVLFAGAKLLELDLTGVYRSDSAGVALLVEWLIDASHKDVPVRFKNVSDQMLAIARISDVDTVLGIN